MLAGIVVSGAYAKSQRAHAARQHADEGRRHDADVPAGRARQRPTASRPWRSGSRRPKGKTFYAYPKMYENSRTNQLMANPSIRNSAVTDLYIAPQQYDPGQPELVGRDVRLTKGTTHQHRRHRLHVPRLQRRPLGHDARREDGPRPDRPDDHAARRLKHDVTLKYVFHMDGARGRGRGRRRSRASPGGKMRVLAVSPNDGAVVLRLTGVSKNPADEFQAGDGRVALGRRDAQAARSPSSGAAST